MTPEEIVLAAQGIVSDYCERWPRAKSVMFGRINVRQRELFTLVREWDRERYGVCVTATLAGGAVDVNAWEAAGVYPLEILDLVQIADPGQSVLAAGKKVHVVPADDVAGHLPPRVTFRSNVLEQVGTDLQSVVSLKVFYARRPKAIGPDGKVGGAAVPVEIESPYDFLLAWDLARDLIRRTIDLEAEAKERALALIAASEKPLLAAYEAHVRGHGYAREQRFG